MIVGLLTIQTLIAFGRIFYLLFKRRWRKSTAWVGLWLFSVLITGVAGNSGSGLTVFLLEALWIGLISRRSIQRSRFWARIRIGASPSAPEDETPLQISPSKTRPTRRFTLKRIPEDRWPGRLDRIFKAKPASKRRLVVMFARDSSLDALDGLDDRELTDTVSKVLGLRGYRVFILAWIVKSTFPVWVENRALIDQYIANCGGVEYPKDPTQFISANMGAHSADFDTLVKLFHMKTRLPPRLLIEIFHERLYTNSLLHFQSQLFDILRMPRGPVEMPKLVNAYLTGMSTSPHYGIRYLYLTVEQFCGIKTDAHKAVSAEIEHQRLSLFETRLKGTNPISAVNLDAISPLDFETFVANVYRSLGYSSRTTKASGDQGADVIADRGNERWAIQVKCYSHPVGNDAVQEALAGKSFYKCTHAAVVTNNTFTSSAKQLAMSAGVTLIDRAALVSMARKVGHNVSS